LAVLFAMRDNAKDAANAATFAINKACVRCFFIVGHTIDQLVHPLFAIIVIIIVIVIVTVTVIIPLMITTYATVVNVLGLHVPI
jgi:hypothetical protein